MKTKDFRMNYESNSFPLLVLLIAITLIFMIVLLAKLPKSANGWIIFASLLAVCFYVYISGKLTYMEVKDGVLTYKSFLADKKVIRVDDIESAWIEIGADGGFKPVIRLIIRPKPELNRKEFYIFPNFQDKANLKIMLEVLPMRDRDGLGETEKKFRDILIKYK